VPIPPKPKPPAFQLSGPKDGTGYHIYVESPTGSGPWPAIIFLDGDDQFRVAVAAHQQAVRAGKAEPLLLVGVGYGASYRSPGNRRIRDYTPSALETEAGSGGADSFLEFLTGTLWPELARRHPVCPDRRGIAGHSLGSLLVLHALFRREPFFDRALASAPSLWWDNRALLCDIQRFQDTGAPLDARLFLGVGDLDSESMLGDLEQFEQQLAARPVSGLAVTSSRFANRDHYNVLVDSFTAGLEALYPRRNPS
jgi:predicted alpha/beta superfamily hydrolase